MSSTVQTYQSVSVEIKINIKDYTDVSSALVVDPKAIREKILSLENKNIISDIGECIVIVGPRPDRVLAKLATRVNVSIETTNKIKDRVQRIENLIKKYSIRGTQFQAAFPDIIFKARESVIKQNGLLQRFCSDDILPIIFQFPGSGPILPDSYRNQEHYGQFNIELTKALSQGKLSVNWSIIEKSLEWKINLPEVDDYDLLVDHTETTPIQSSSSSTSKAKKSKGVEKKDKL